MIFNDAKIDRGWMQMWWLLSLAVAAVSLFNMKLANVKILSTSVSCPYEAKTTEWAFQIL